MIVNIIINLQETSETYTLLIVTKCE